MQTTKLFEQVAESKISHFNNVPRLFNMRVEEISLELILLRYL